VFLDLDVTGHLDSFLRFRIATRMLYLHFLWTGATYSQSSSFSFGPKVDSPLGYSPAGLVISKPYAQIAILSEETPTLSFYSMTPNAEFTLTDKITLPALFRDVVTEVDQRGEATGFCLLSADGESVMVLQTTKRSFSEVKVVQTAKRKFSERTYRIEGPSQRIAFGDINSNRRNDILLFGKRRTGVTPLLRQEGGTYTVGQVLFPDVSISDLVCRDLNGDQISDLLILNWLSNQLALLYGIGQGVYSEQVGISLDGEPSRIAVSPVARDRSVLIAVTLPEERLVSVFLCNATGEIDPVTTSRFSSPPTQVRFAFINDDAYVDLLVTDEHILYVFLGEPHSRFGPPTPFGAGKQIVSWEVMDIDGDAKADVVALDRKDARVLAYGNSAWSGTVQWPSTYGVGQSPKAVAILDMNGDGLHDVVVANSGTSSLSLLRNAGGGRMSGQQSVSLTDRPFSVRAVKGRVPGSYTILSSMENSDKIGIVHLNTDMTVSDVFTLPTGPKPHIVLAKHDSSSGHLELLTRYTNPGDASLSLSLFTQISGGQLVERNIRASLTGRITALTAGEFLGAGRYELVFATHDALQRQTSLSFALPDREFDFTTITPLLSFLDSSASVHALLSGYLDDDGFHDVVVPLSSPRNALGLVYGRSGGLFADTLDFLRGVHLLNEDALLLQDVDNDGHVDLRRFR
jgi:hypothetical protein